MNPAIGGLTQMREVPAADRPVVRDGIRSRRRPPFAARDGMEHLFGESRQSGVLLTGADFMAFRSPFVGVQSYLGRIFKSAAGVYIWQRLCAD
jgi:hypothetical protein